MPEPEVPTRLCAAGTAAEIYGLFAICAVAENLGARPGRMPRAAPRDEADSDSRVADGRERAIQATGKAMTAARNGSTGRANIA